MQIYNRRSLIGLSLASVGAWFGLPWLCTQLERRLLYQPTVLPANHPLPPAVEGAWFETPDQLKLHGFLVEPPGQSLGVVLYCHGNGGCIDMLDSYAQTLANRYQVTLFCFDYRGYGRSEGVPSAAGIVVDARAARKWLAHRTGVREADVVLMGLSLGGGVAVELASQDGCRGLILEDTFATLPAVAELHVGYVLSSLMQAQFRSVEKIQHYHGPLLQRHGTRDEVVPFAHGQRLFAAANEPKQFVTTVGGTHCSSPNEEFYMALGQFFAALPPAS